MSIFFNIFLISSLSFSSYVFSGWTTGFDIATLEYGFICWDWLIPLGDRLDSVSILEDTGITGLLPTDFWITCELIFFR